jgi:hypothetical protein
LRSKTCSQRRFKRTVGIGALIGLTLLLALPVAGQGGSAIVRTDPTVVEVAAGQTATVQFVLADAQNAYGIDVRATFDPKVVEVVDADPGADGVQMTPGDFLRPDFVVRNVADNEKGTLRYALTQVNPSQPVSGTGVLFTVQFRGKAAGETALTLAPVEMADRQGQLLPVTIQGGTIKVVASQASTQVPAPTQPAQGAEPTAAAAPTAAAVPTVVPAATAQPAASPALPGGLPCAGGVLLPSMGLLGLAGWGVSRRRKGDISG